jgi:hypothetical protein
MTLALAIRRYPYSLPQHISAEILACGHGLVVTNRPFYGGGILLPCTSQLVVYDLRIPVITSVA